MSSPPAVTPRRRARWRARKPDGSATSCGPRARSPRGSTSALYEVSEAVRGRGLNVELVTADLGGDVADRVVAPLREAVHITLLAAQEFVGAERAVVRAVSDAGDISVTVRHHVGGFVPGTDSLYERRLAALGPLLAPISGRVETWSEAQSGVRVTLTVSDITETVAGSSSPAQAGPSVERLAPVLPGDGAVSIETDATPGWFDPGRPLDRGVLPDERAEADRTIFTLFMAWRWSGLATGVAALIAGRRRYRSPAAAVTQLGVALAESAWLARSIRRDGYRFGRRGRLVDGAASVALLVAGRANLVDEDLWTWINWTPWSFAANAVAGQAVSDGSFHANAATAGIISVAGATLAARSTDRIVNGVGLASCFAVGQVFVRQIRNGARRLEVARAAAVEEGRVLASERERSRQLRLLHDGALQTLETVGSGRYADLSGVRALAREEAQRLEDELAGTMAPEVTLVEAITSLVREHGRFGLHIDLSVEGATEPLPRVRRALQDAANEALTNVRKHAGISQAQVSITRAGGGVQVAIHDQGAGFDPTQRAGFGTVESIVRRMAEVGGRAEIESRDRERNQSDVVGADMISVAIVDDHPVYRQGLAMVVDNAEDLELVGEAKSIEDFDKLESSVDVVLLDLHLPGIDGSAGVAHVCDAGYRALVVSAAGTPEDVIDAIAAGAVGYLTKETDADEITRAIRTVAAGDTYVSPTLASYLLRAEKSASEYQLTKREPRRVGPVGGRGAGPRHRGAALHRHHHRALASRADPRQDRCPSPG